MERFYFCAFLNWIIASKSYLFVFTGNRILAIGFVFVLEYNFDKFLSRAEFAYAYWAFFINKICPLNALKKLFTFLQRKGIRMLQIKNCKLTHKKDLRVILDNFKLTLNYGDKAVLIGEEGNGKSTLLKWIYDPGLIEDYVEAEGTRILNNERLAYLPQELPQGDQEKTVYEYFSEQESFYDKSPKELNELAHQFGMPEDVFYNDISMKHLSGGEKIKVQLMRILLGHPTVLLLDEPSNDIDLDTLHLLEKVLNDFEYIVLYISHDEILIEKTANMIIHIEQVSRKTKSRFTVAKQSYEEYIQNRQYQYDKQEQEALNDRRAKAIREEKYRRLLQKVEHAQAGVSRQDPSIGKNLKDKMHAVKSMGKRFERLDQNMTEMPEQEEAIYFKIGGKDSYIPAGKTVIEFSLDTLYTQDQCRILAKNIKLILRGNVKMCIIGKNGCGKTTLLKKIADELCARNDIRAEYMPQNYEDQLNLDVTPIDYLDQSGDKEERTRIRTYLGSLKFTADEMNHPIRELSGGQKAKVLLLRMSLSGANVLILDEPTRNFSPLSCPVIRSMLKDFEGAIISISHDRKYMREVCDEVYKLTSDGLFKTIDAEWM